MAVAFADDAFVLAGHGRRIAAALLDGVLGSAILGACGAAGFGVGLIGAGGTHSDGWEALGWIVVGTVLGVTVGIFAWVALTVWLARRPGARNGQTLGKQMLGLRVVRADRRAIGGGWALLREVVAKVMLVGFTSMMLSTLMGYLDTGLLGAAGTIAIWYGPALVDEQRRGLHDRICDTRVVVADQLFPAPASVAPASPAAADDLWPAST